ncbi:MAG: PQQ-dependent sugar dehydrogenase [Pseudomonadales bacterium]
MRLPGILLLVLLVGGTPPARAQAHPERLRVPDGFAVTMLNDRVENARQMALGGDGTLYVGTQRAGRVYALPQLLGDAPRADVVVLAEDLDLPSGVAYRDGDLYVGAVSRVLRFPAVATHLQPNAPYQVVTDRLPAERHHGWKYLGFGPDGMLYVPVGAPCNLCLSEDPRFASLLRMDPASGATTVYASGIRNTVGFDWHPGTGNLWFTDNGRDLLGDDVPPEEVNEVTAPGQHFGYPFVHAGDIRDPELGATADPADYVPPRVKIQAHSAALGMKFYRGSAFPARYRGALFIAEHGSWNRSSKVGYQVSVVTFDAAGFPSYAPFVTGWLNDADGGRTETSWGRPNDVLVAPDGSLLISDDQAGAIYVVRYLGPGSSEDAAPPAVR